MQAAALFQASVLRDLDHLRKRKRWLIFLEVIVFAFFVIFFTVMLICQFELWLLTELIVWLSCASAMTLVTILSMRHINQSSKSLKQLGISTNSRIMILYVSIWVLFCFVCAAIISLSIYIQTQVSPENMLAIESIMDNPKPGNILKQLFKLPDHPKELIKLVTVITYLFVPGYFLMDCLSLMILVIYFKFSERLTESATD